MSTEIKSLKGVYQSGNECVNADVECRVHCDRYHDTLSLHAAGTIISVPLKDVEATIKKARRK